MSSMAELVKRVIADHFALETGIEKIALFADEREQELRLVEVNAAALPTGQVEPFVFAAGEAVPLPMMIADVTPVEWEALTRGQLPLPQGWPQRPMRVYERGQPL